jgi:1,2-dihydroxy-3-keto-5-methylthiopentene dioxygenase
MKAYYFDNSNHDQRASHYNGRDVSVAELKNIGVLAYHFDDIADVDKLSEERNYVNRDIIKISPEAMGDIYQDKIKTFYSEHLHEDEEIRYIMDGEGYFDVRNEKDEWIRVQMTKGDLLILPAGIYHRFTTSEKDYIQAMRLFKEEPKWVPHNRPCDENEYRIQYVKSLA